MAELVPFINREKELAQIDSVIKEWGTRRVLCIDGEGGIGKTRLLQQVRRLSAEDSKRAPLIVADIIDFDDRTCHIAQNVDRRIAQMLSKNAFKPYLHRLLDYRKMEMGGVSTERLAQESRAVDQAFVECFNEVTTQQRVVLLWDTLDALEGTEPWDYLFGLGLQLENVVLIVAGRNARRLWKSLRPQLGQDVQLIDLPPLAEEASEMYVQQKQEQLHIALEPELAQKLLLLAGGRPILIDLAVEWRARAIPLDWLVKSSLKELESLSDKAMQERQQEFEYQLVRHIADTRQPIDWLTLVMSRVYPLDVEMIVELLKMPRDEAEKLFEEAQTYAFVKSLPDGRISLHDEMRRMVNKHVWPEVDPDGDRKRRDSWLAAESLKRKVWVLDEQIAQLAEQEKIARDKNDVEAELHIFTEHETSERELWVLEGRRLRHALLADIDKGVETFIELFDRVTRSYRLSLRASLLVQVQRYVDQLSPEQLYKVDSRRVKHLLDSGEYTRAREMATKMLARESIEPGQRLNMLTLLANSNTLLGYLPEAVKQLEIALRICGENPGLARWKGTVLNTLGRVNRMMGYLERASNYYKQALQEVKDKAQIASLLNNIGYIWSLEGRYRSALNYCEQALSVHKQLGLKRETGASLSIIGEIYRNWGKYDQAVEYYNDALEIFEPEGDPLWLARLYSYRGAVYRLQSKFDLAETNLRRSIALQVRVEQPWAHHVLGCVFWNRGNLDEALRFFKISDKLAYKVHDVRTRVNNLVGSAEVYYAQWINSGQAKANLPSQIKKQAEELERLLAHGYDFPHHFGRVQRLLADLAFEEKRYDEALGLYAEAYALLGRRSGGYGRRTFFDELDMLAQRIVQLAQEYPQEAVKWCQKLREHWSDESRPIMRRDVLVSMCDVREIEVKLLIKQEVADG